MSDLVHVHDQGHARRIALNRPDKMNVLSHALAWAIVTELQKAAGSTSRDRARTSRRCPRRNG